MRRLIILILALMALVTTALFVMTLRRPAPKGADLLAESTLVFVQAPDYSASQHRFRETALHALWQEPQIQQLAQQPRRALREWVQRGEMGALENVLLRRVMGSVKGEVFIALTHVSVFGPFQVGLVVGADTRHRRLEAEAAVAAAKAAFQQEYPDATVETQKFLGSSYTRWELPGRPPVCTVFLNSLFVATLGEAAMRELLMRHETAAPDPLNIPLSASPRFRRVLNQMPRDHEWLGYVNVGGIAGLLAPLLAMSGPQGMEAYRKLSAIEAIGVSVTFEGALMKEVLYVAHAEGAAAAPQPATPRRSLRLTSPETLLHTTQSVDIEAGYRQLLDALAQAPQAGAVGALTAFQQQLAERGIRIEEDLLARLGPETSLVLEWPAEAAYPSVALAIGLRETDKARPAVDLTLELLREALAGLVPARDWAETEVDGHRLRMLELADLAVAPTYLTTDEFFILTLDPAFARELLGRARQTKPTLETNPSYRQHIGGLPAGGTSYLWCDLRGLSNRLCALVESAVRGPGDWFELPDAMKLPSCATIERHLHPIVSATVADSRGQTTTTIAPLSPTWLVGGALAATGYMWLRDFDPSRFDLMRDAPTASSDRLFDLWERENQTGESRSPVPR
jgi:hypothetical protein